MLGLFRNSGCFNSSQNYEIKNKPTNISETIFNKAQKQQSRPRAEVVIVILAAWNFRSAHSNFPNVTA